MNFLLAQTTQAAGTGFANWTPEQWLGFLTQLATLVLGIYATIKARSASSAATNNTTAVVKLADAVDPNDPAKPSGLAAEVRAIVDQPKVIEAAPPTVAPVSTPENK